MRLVPNGLVYEVVPRPGLCQKRAGSTCTTQALRSGHCLKLAHYVDHTKFLPYNAADLQPFITG